MYVDKYEKETIWGPSMETCRARQRAAFGEGCKCGSKRDPDPRVRKAANREWVQCQRCLGTIRQLS